MNSFSVEVNDQLDFLLEYLQQGDLQSYQPVDLSVTYNTLYQHLLQLQTQIFNIHLHQIHFPIIKQLKIQSIHVQPELSSKSRVYLFRRIIYSKL